MEGMSGTEAAGVLRRHHPGLPVVLLSAYADEGIVKPPRTRRSRPISSRVASARAAVDGRPAVRKRREGGQD